jgi:hypothetical protein
MSFAVLATNSSIKINAAVNNSLTAVGNLYTAPANSYAIVQVSVRWTTTGTRPKLTLAGNTILEMEVNGGGAGFVWNGQAAASTTNKYSIITNIMVGPSQVLAIADGTASQFQAIVTGVEFINSP